MPIRRLNFTGRQRIARESVMIVVDRSTSPLSFEAVLDLAHSNFPPEAEVVIEASVDWTVARFAWGTVGEPPTISRKSLAQFDVPEGLRFAVKILGVGANAGLILGEASSIVPSDPEMEKAARSFVDVRPARLGHIAWKLIVDQSHPIVLVNETVGDWKAFSRSASFRTLVAPEVFRQLLYTAADGDPDFDGDMPGPSWESQCLILASQLSHQSLPIPPDDNQRDRWVDEAVDAFARHHRFGAILRTLLDLEDMT